MEKKGFFPFGNPSDTVTLLFTTFFCHQEKPTGGAEQIYKFILLGILLVYSWCNPTCARYLSWPLNIWPTTPDQTFGEKVEQTKDI
jgi:hypothetical protein